MSNGFPFSAVVGADDAKLALLLAAIDSGIGGVLLRGDKGSAKTTLARGLAGLMEPGAPFVDLPVGATEDRVIGSLDLGAALTEATVRFRPGLLAAADGGVLYVDEVNLLPDHLVDVLLDVAATGVNRVEREGLAHVHDARFVLIGSMNPEEGELRPQLLDRFGLCVDVCSPSELESRAEAIRRRLAWDVTGRTEEWDGAEAALAARVAAGRGSVSPTLPAGLIGAVAALCSSVGVEGLRADLVICRAAAALARLEGRGEVSDHDVRRVAPFALAHRARRHPLDQHGIDQGRLDEALDQALGSGSESGSGSGAAGSEAGGAESGGSGSDSGFGGAGSGGAEPASAGAAPAAEAGAAPAAERVSPVGPPATVARLEVSGRKGAPTRWAAGRRSTVEGARGRLVADRAPDDTGPTSIAVGATVREAAMRRASSPDLLPTPSITAGDLREGVRQAKTGNLIVLAVDASGSMGADRRMEATKAAVLGLLVDAYQRRDRVALVTFRGDDATVTLRPTGSVEVARTRLSELPTGGRTPLAAGISAALGLTDSISGYPPLLVLVTDGRATSAPAGQDPWEAARSAAAQVCRRRIPAIVVDVEKGPTRLGFAGEVATAMGAPVVTLEELTGERLIAAVRSVATGR